MSVYYLRDEGFAAYKKIYHGRRWVGRVVKHASEPGFVGIIKGVGDVREPTEIEAFEKIAAKAMGFDSVEALDEANRRARASRRAQKARAAYAVGEMLRGNYEPLMNALEKGSER